MKIYLAGFGFLLIGTLPHRLFSYHLLSEKINGYYEALEKNENPVTDGEAEYINELNKTVVHNANISSGHNSKRTS